MPKLNWGTAGERYFEAGIDRGVLYPKSGASGVAWNGLISVSESPSGGEPKPYYVDGIKYLNLAAGEEFQATITAFSAPSEFYRCDGTNSALNGLLITQQPRESFGLSYRTKVGNDTDGIDHGYKLHLVYNALTAPSQRDNTSLGGGVSPVALTWSVSTTPPSIVGHRPTAHFVIDSRTTSLLILEEVEDILYGTPLSNPRLPTISELLAIFT